MARTTIKGTIIWVQDYWKPYKYGEFRKFTIWTDKGKLQCSAWKQEYWPEEGIQRGRRVTVTGILKDSPYGPQLSLRDTQIHDLHRERREFTFSDDQIQFWDGEIRVYSKNPWVKGKIPDKNSSYALQKFRKKVDMNIHATIFANARVVGYKDGIPCSFLIDEDSEIVDKGWASLERAAENDAEARKWRQYVREAKRLLEKNTDEEGLRKLAKEHGVEKDEFISIIFPNNYDQEYFDFLKEHSQRHIYNHQGFIFTLNDGRIAWENPKTGATYLFESQDLATLAARLGTHNIRTELRSNKIAAEDLRMIKFIIHSDFDVWKEKLGL